MKHLVIFSDNLGIPSTQQNDEPLIPNEIQESEYRGLVQMLNKSKESLSITVVPSFVFNNLLLFFYRATIVTKLICLHTIMLVA